MPGADLGAALVEDRFDPIAAGVLDHPGHVRGDSRAAASELGEDAGERASGRRVAGQEGGQFGAVQRQAALASKTLAVRHDDIQRQHVVLGGPVGDRPGARSIGADHASQAAVVLAGGIGREEHAVGLQVPVEGGHHHARLHPDPGRVGGHLETSVHVAGEVHLDARAYRGAVESRAHAARNQGRPRSAA